MDADMDILTPASVDTRLVLLTQDTQQQVLVLAPRVNVRDFSGCHSNTNKHSPAHLSCCSCSYDIDAGVQHLLQPE